MSKDNYAIWDMKENKFLSKILISLEEAKSFYKLCVNKNKRIIYFGWHVIPVEESI